MLCALGVYAYGVEMLELQPDIPSVEESESKPNLQLELFDRLQKATSAKERFYLYVDISLSYKRLLDYTSALRYLELAERTMEKVGKDREMEFRYLFEMAQLRFDILHYEEASRLADRIEADYNDLPSATEKAYLAINRGYIFFLQNDYAAAEEKLLEARALLKRYNTCEVPLVNAKLIELYSADDKNEKIAALFHEGLQISKSCDLLKYTRFLHYTIIKHYQKIGDFHQAYNSFLVIDTLNNVLGDCSNILKLNSAEQDLFIRQQNATIELNEQRVKNRNLMLAMTLSVFILTASVSANIVYRDKKNQLKKSALKAKQFTEMLLARVEDERQRISKDLHDEVGHNLLELKWQLHGEPSAKLDQVDNVIASIRHICKDLYPVNFKELGLPVYLEDLVKNAQQNFPINIEYTNSFVGRLPLNTELHLYRCVQEIMSNIVKYAEATHIQINIKNSDKHLLIEVLDNGKNFDYEHAIQSTRESFGLSNIQERAHILKGVVTYSRKNDWNLVSIKIPIDIDENITS